MSQQRDNINLNCKRGSSIEFAAPLVLKCIKFWAVGAVVFLAQVVFLAWESVTSSSLSLSEPLTQVLGFFALPAKGSKFRVRESRFAGRCCCHKAANESPMAVIELAMRFTFLFKELSTLSSESLLSSVDSASKSCSSISSGEEFLGSDTQGFGRGIITHKKILVRSLQKSACK